MLFTQKPGPSALPGIIQQAAESPITEYGTRVGCLDTGWVAALLFSIVSTRWVKEGIKRYFFIASLKYKNHQNKTHWTNWLKPKMANFRGQVFQYLCVFFIFFLKWTFFQKGWLVCWRWSFCHLGGYFGPFHHILPILGCDEGVHDHDALDMFQNLHWVISEHWRKKMPKMHKTDGFALQFHQMAPHHFKNSWILLGGSFFGSEEGGSFQLLSFRRVSTLFENKKLAVWIDEQFFKFFFKASDKFWQTLWTGWVVSLILTILFPRGGALTKLL